MLLLFGLPFLGLSCALGRQLFDTRTGVALVVMLGTSFSIFPYLGIVQTDAAVSVGFLIALIGAIAYQREPGWRPTGLMGLGLGVALASKYSGVLLIPTLVLALWIGDRPSRRCARVIVRTAIVAATGLVVLWVSYATANLAYERGGGGQESIRVYCRDAGVRSVAGAMRSWEPALLRLEAISPSAAQWTTGFVALHLSNRIGTFPSYVAGEIDSGGRWWYFPFVLLLRLPLGLLGVTAAASIAACRHSRNPLKTSSGWHRRATVVLAATAGMYLAVAMTSSINIGIRHLIPVMPILLLPAAR